MTLEQPQVQREPKRDILGGDVGRRIRARRLARGMTLAQVGRTDLSRSFLSLVETGRSRISLRALALVAERLDTPIGAFLADEDTTLTTDLVFDLAELDLEAGNVRRALSALERAATTTSGSARGLYLLGRALLESGRASEAISALRGAEESRQFDGAPVTEADLEFTMARALLALHNMAEALAHFRKALKHIGEGADQPEVEARVNLAIGAIMTEQGQLQAAAKHHQRALDLLLSLDEAEKIVTGYTMLSESARKRSEMREASHYAKLALGASKAMRQRREVSAGLNTIVGHFRMAGELDKAVELAYQSVSQAHAAGAPESEAQAHAVLAEVFLEQGDVDQAVREAGLAESLAPNDSSPARVSAWVVQANAAHRMGEHERVDQLYQQALKTLRSQSRTPRFADTALGYSRLLKERGETERALEVALEAAESSARSG